MFINANKRKQTTATFMNMNGSTRNRLILLVFFVLLLIALLIKDNAKKVNDLRDALVESYKQLPPIRTKPVAEGISKLEHIRTRDFIRYDCLDTRRIGKTKNN